MMERDKDSWSEWSRHILAELHRLNECTDGIESKIDTLRYDFIAKMENLKDDFYQQMNRIHVEVAMLKVKSGMWGLLGGLIPVLTLILIEILAKK